MSRRLALLLVGSGFIVACGSSDDDNPAADAQQRSAMRTEIEGTWTGPLTYPDGRAATTAALTLAYRGSGQSAPRCGEHVLDYGVEGALGLQCITIYTLPLDAHLSIADGAHANDATTLHYDNVLGLSGTAGAAMLSAQLKEGHLEGSLDEPGGGSFSLLRH
jgi:hypothetical protein